MIGKLIYISKDDLFLDRVLTEAQVKELMAFYRVSYYRYGWYPTLSDAKLKANICGHFDTPCYQYFGLQFHLKSLIKYFEKWKVDIYGYIWTGYITKNNE